MVSPPAALKVSCGWCRAEVDKPCRTNSGNTCAPHDYRWRRYRDRFPYTEHRLPSPPGQPVIVRRRLSCTVEPVGLVIMHLSAAAAGLRDPVMSVEPGVSDNYGEPYLAVTGVLDTRAPSARVTDIDLRDAYAGDVHAG